MNIFILVKIRNDYENVTGNISHFLFPLKSPKTSHKKPPNTKPYFPIYYKYLNNL